MKKIHIDHADYQEDLQVIKLIKRIDLEGPSDSFAENTLSKFLAEKDRAVHTHQALRLPLIFMLALTGLLVLPLLLNHIGGPIFSVSMQEFYASITLVPHEFQTWYLIYPMALLVVLLLLTHLTMRFLNKQHITQ